MTKKITLKNSKVFGLILLLLGLLGSSAINTSFAQTYCNPYSYYGCNYSNVSYATIEKVQIKDISNNVIFNKAADGCNQNATNYNVNPNGYTLMSTTPSFTLSAGSKYTFGLSVSMTNGSTVYSYSQNTYVWVDVNADGTFQSNEFVSQGWAMPTSGNAKGVGGNIQFNTFTLPCGVKPGQSRLRIICSYSYTMSPGTPCPQGSSGPYYYGESEDYTINLALPTSLAAGFFMPSTAFTGTPVKMTNNNQTGYISHAWDIDDDGTVQYTTTNATHIFNTPGTNCVRLKSVNCLGRDSILKCVQINDPTAPPVVDFASNANEVERFGTVDFLDLSTNGPTYWSWYMYDPIDSVGTRQDVETYNSAALVGNDPFINANPEIFFNRIGTYTVCLQTSNSQGPSSLLCKKDYVRVTPFKDNNMGAGTVQPIYESTGNILDDGGRTGNYSKNRVDYATIIPCGAKKITLTFSQFKIFDTGDQLKIYDGPDASGVPLHTGNGFTKGNEPKGPIVATSGAMYLYFSTNGSGEDSGFIASWTTEKGAVAKPVASFEVPDTLYNPNYYTFVNTSLNVLGKTDYVWEINPGYGEVGYAKDLDYALLTDNTYDVTLTATTCMGTSTYTKSVVVVTPHTKASVDFKADNRRPVTGETVTITPFRPELGKAMQADKFQWTFFPGTVSVISQDMYTGAIKVKFNAKGKYTVSLRAWNTLDSSATSASVIKADFIIVVEHCTPLLGVSASSDVVINNVKLTDANNVNLIDNTSLNNAQGYDDYTLTNISATISFGTTYTISTSRFTNVNPMSRKVWIDWNIDGDFSDAGELVATEATATTASFSATFKVPDNTTAFEGKTRMRIGTSYSTDPNEPCGAASGVTNANRIGEFEDYRIFVVNDMKPPVLTLNNDDTLYLEVGTTYTEYNATAIDPTEGDISSRITIVSDVDMAFTGIYYVTYNVKDAGGNPAIPVTRVVYVVKDQTKPVITLNGNDTVWVEVFGTYTEDGATASDNKDGNISNAIVIDGMVNTSVLGTYVLTYRVNDVAGNSATKNRIVIVRDSEKPVISNSDAVLGEVKVQILSIFIDRTKVTDNYDNPTLIVTPGSSGPVDTRFKGTYPMIYDATDGSGNMATTLTIKYIVDDYIGPEINLNTLDTVIWPVNKAYVPVQASVEDNFYDNSQVSLTRTSNVNPFKLGLYYDEFKATDGSGNITTRRRYVRVIDNIAPVINGSSMNVGLFSTVDASEGLTITDNYDAPSVLKPRMVVIYNNLNTYVEGLYSVTFVVSDLSGNMSQPYERSIWVNRMFPTIGPGSVSTLDNDKTINVFPNPSTGIINISYNFATPETMDIQVFNVTGALVAEIKAIHGQNGVQTIDLSDEASGLYTVRTRVNGRQINRKVSVRRR